MRLKSAIVIAVLAGLVITAAAARQPDGPGFKDPGLFTRMPTAYGDWVKEAPFDAYSFQVSDSKQERVEGHMFTYLYRWDEEMGPRPSTLQIIRNYENAAKSIGGRVLYENDEIATLRIAKGDKDIWVSVEPGGPQMQLVIVKRQAMKQDILADAQALQGGLAAQGHVEVPGIFFDFNKAVVKPESKPALDQVARMLKAEPSLKVYVVGHTDAVGTLEANLRLSEARAQAVAKALAEGYGISPARLKGCGVGPLSPVASNDTEEGRAKNRRVELVKQ